MVVEGGQSEAALEFLRTLGSGQVRQGVVTSIERCGVFVDLDGADGLVLVPELAWCHFEDASEIVQVGQEVVMVLDVDLECAQVSLSLKALQSDPRVEIARTRPSPSSRTRERAVNSAGVGAVGVGCWHPVTTQPLVENCEHIAV
ncbi:S1 RNA-binding domain-containing protein [Microtetraspora sp. AC03309]|uniref:S1 RNA-binding domain-containing protein n=1 Tax=Microtetraspora sp. AC03309 TaxID=2779376 RepID=UPI0035B272A3